MSGTSLDGIDGILTSFKKKHYTFHVPFPKKFKNDLLSLQSKGLNEIHREATASINLVKLYSKCVKMLLQKANIDKSQVKAIGAHGQTIRHQPEIGYSKQINNPSLLSELTGIDVISDFRKVYNNEADIYDLELWHQYESRNPQVFAGMYQFWCQKKLS